MARGVIGPSPVFRPLDSNGLIMPGFKLYSYIAGTTTHQNIYADQALTTPLAQPAIANASGALIFYVDSGLTYKFNLTDSADVQQSGWPIDNLVGGEDNILPIMPERYGAVGDGTTVDTTAFQNAIAALTAGSVLQLGRGKTYRLTGLLTISVARITIRGNGATLNWTAFGASTFGSLGAGTAGIHVTANQFTIEDCTIIGPHVATFSSNANAIQMVGTSTSNRLRGLTVRNCDISQAGSAAVAAQFVDDMIITDNYIHNCGYIGVGGFSCNYAFISGNRVKTITPGTAANMYGITMSHDSTNYSTNPGAGTKSATHPFSWGARIVNNVVDDVNWQGIDFHGAYDSSVIGNHCYACRAGIAVASGSGDATNYAGSDNQIIGNTIDAANSNGTASGRENTSIGITINGGSTAKHTRVQVLSNTLINYGVVSSANSYAIAAVHTDGPIIADNIIINWGGGGVLLDAFTGIATVRDNHFRSLANGADTVAKAIACNTASAGLLIVTGNAMLVNGRFGLDFASMTTRPIVSDNDFKAATVGETNPPSTGFIRGSGYPNIRVSVDETTPSISAESVPGLPFILTLTPTGPLTITNITGGREGQVVILHNTTTNTVTITRANAALSASVNWTGDQHDSITLMRVGSLWKEIGRSGNNG